MFRYLRLFAIFSCLVILCIALAAGVLLRSLGAGTLIHRDQILNVALVQGYVNSVWKNYEHSDSADLAHNAKFIADTNSYFQGMDLTRVNVYGKAGAVLLSMDVNADEAMLGKNASPDIALVIEGQTTQKRITHLLHGIALKNTGDATLVQTLVPLNSTAALEIIFNDTAAWNNLVERIFIAGGIFISLFMAFFGALFFTSRKMEILLEHQHQQNIVLAAAAATAEAENREKSLFLANVSHELRTPLNAIIGFSDIIREEVAITLDKKYFDYINDINLAGVHLLSLINDILDYSKAEAGKLEMEVSEVNGGKLIQNCMRLVSPRAESGQIKLIENMPREPLTMLTDSKKFRQIFLNLLSNAVKFTHPGGEVQVSAWHEAGSDEYRFEVRDTGIGIASADIALALSPFGQVDNALSRKYEGTGLGLPLTKKFVELMGGKFTIDSKLNVGTVITFTLPRELKSRDGLTIKPAV